MPNIENERKFVLDPKIDLEKYLRKNIKVFGLSVIEIEQCYLSRSGRIRCSRYTHVKGKSRKKVQYHFTCKYPLTRSNRVGDLEFEVKIKSEDWENAYPETIEKVKKIRYVFPKSGDEKWEIDFFKDSDQKTFFILAECEMPPDRMDVKNILNLISDNLLFQVKQGDSRFSNRNLSDIERTKLLSNELKTTII